jgi:hypothetical protein
LTFLLLTLAACGLKGEPPIVDRDQDGFAPPDDCNDNDAGMNPGAVEICDGVDQNCNGRTDEDATDVLIFCPDSDGDGYGDPEREVPACEASGVLVEDCTDCNDLNEATHPGAAEFCDDHDNDCDGETDEHTPEGDDGVLMYADDDGDGWGDDGDTVRACERADGWVDRGEDCDDTNAAVHPHADEECDGVDADCDPKTLDADIVTIVGTGTWTSIAEALNHAVAGDTLMVCPGRYAQRLTLSEDISIVGVGGADVTFIDTAGASTGVVISGGAVHLEGLTIENCGTSGSPGGAIYARDAGSLDLVDMVLRSNVADYGAGVYGPTSGDFTATRTDVADNDFRTAGGGMVVFGGVFTELSVTGNAPLTPDTGTGGGIFVDGRTAPAIVDCAGGCDVRANEALWGGGAMVTGAAEINSATFAENRADAGGGLWAYDTTLLVDHCSVVSNTATSSAGGMLVEGETEVTVYFSDFGSGATDNQPNDVSLSSWAGSYSGWGAGSTFTCSDVVGVCE